MEYNVYDEYIIIIKTKLKQADFNDALEYAGRMIEYDSSNPSGHYFRGLCYYGMDDYIRSIDEYIAAIRIDPDYAKAYFNMALSKYRLGIPKEALEDVYKARDIFMRAADQDALDKCNMTIELLNEDLAI